MPFNRSDRPEGQRNRRPGGMRRRRKVCVFCAESAKPVDYKDVATLREVRFFRAASPETARVTRERLRLQSREHVTLLCFRTRWTKPQAEIREIGREFPRGNSLFCVPETAHHRRVCARAIKRAGQIMLLLSCLPATNMLLFGQEAHRTCRIPRPDRPSGQTRSQSAP